MVAERGSELEFLCGRCNRILDGRCAKMCDQLLGQRVDRGETICLAHVDDLHQGRPAERGDAEKARAECGARFAVKRRRILVPKDESAGNRQLARLCGHIENECVRCIEANGA